MCGAPTVLINCISSVLFVSISFIFPLLLALVLDCRPGPVDDFTNLLHREIIKRGQDSILHYPRLIVKLGACGLELFSFLIFFSGQVALSNITRASQLDPRSGWFCFHVFPSIKARDKSLENRSGLKFKYQTKIVLPVRQLLKLDITKYYPQSKQTP